jgi:hypothetical protein
MSEKEEFFNKLHSALGPIKRRAAKLLFFDFCEMHKILHEGQKDVSRVTKLKGYESLDKFVLGTYKQAEQC